MEKAKKLQQESKRALEELMHNSPVKFSTADIKRWYQLEAQSSLASSGSQDYDDDETSWEVKYFSLLQVFYSIRDEVQTCKRNHLRQVIQRVNRIDIQLQAIEQKQGIQRWTEDSDVYLDFKRMEEEKEKNRIADSIATCARERWFLLNLKAKFADGQYLASRLSKSINQESAKLKQLIQKFNALPCAEKMNWSDATDLSSFLWLRGVLQSDTCIPKNVKLDAIKHHHLAMRADEEIHLLQGEMKATFLFFWKDWQQLSNVIDQLKLQPCTQYNNGAVCLLQLARLKCEGLLHDLKSSYSRFIDLPVLPIDRSVSQLFNHTLIDNSCGRGHTDEENSSEESYNRDNPDLGSLPRSKVYSDDEKSQSSDEESSDSGAENSYSLSASTLSVPSNPLAPQHIMFCQAAVPPDVLTYRLPMSSPSTTPSQKPLSVSQPPKKVCQSIRLSSAVRKTTGNSHLAKKPTLTVQKPLLVSQPIHGPSPLKLFVEKPLSTSHLMKEPSSVTQPIEKPSESGTKMVEEPNDSTSSGDEDNFPTREEVKRRCLRLEREEFLKQQRREDPSYHFTEEDKRMLASITEGEVSGHKTNKGYLHWKKEDLQRAVDSSRKALSLSRVLHAGPHFVRHAKNKSYSVS